MRRAVEFWCRIVALPLFAQGAVASPPVRLVCATDFEPPSRTQCRLPSTAVGARYAGNRRARGTLWGHDRIPGWGDSSTVKTEPAKGCGCHVPPPFGSRRGGQWSPCLSCQADALLPPPPPNNGSRNSSSVPDRTFFVFVYEVWLELPCS